MSARKDLSTTTAAKRNLTWTCYTALASQTYIYHW